MAHCASVRVMHAVCTEAGGTQHMMASAMPIVSSRQALHETWRQGASECREAVCYHCLAISLLSGCS